MPDAYLRGPIAYHETMAEILALDRDCSKRHTGWVADLESLRDDYRNAVEAVGALLAIVQAEYREFYDADDAVGENWRSAIVLGEAVLAKQKKGD